MSKVNQIQSALLEMGGGKFQKLADAYLVEKQFGRVNSIGSVIAANKVRTGTPDSLITTPQGHYIFAEYTTQQSGLLGKMKGDLDKCFDEVKTGIPLDRIERVIFCFTGRLDAEEENELAEVCHANGVNLDLFGIDAIAFDLYSKYPGLARDFLGVQIDTGQIVPPDRFVSLYNSNKLATRLDLGFRFRENELSSLLDKLKKVDLVFLGGRAGVGKSRLALEVCRRFSEENLEYEVLCVFGRNRDLWEDLQMRFRKPGHFLVMVDDANRVSRFEYVVDLLQHQREDQQIKVVATVRDYALKKVIDAARPLGDSSELLLQPFTDKQIKEFISDEYSITNYRYLERIVEIAGGNPRLAVMAAEVAKEGPLSNINDVSALYDIYFSSIREDLKSEGADLGSNDLVRVAAIVSFFKSVDRTNEEMMRAIEVAFDITPAVLWEAADRLHELELLDMHENEVVRISDQVLGTYLFYLAVFKEEVLNFGALLTHFFPRLKHRLIDSLNPVLNAFDTKHIINSIQPHVNKACEEFEMLGNEEGILHLLDVFWFTNQTDTLLWARDRIESLKPETVEITNVKFEKNSNALSSPSILSVLKPFAFVEEDEVRIALNLLMRYLAKRPSDVPTLLWMLIENYGFKHDSHLRGFEVQRAVVDEVWRYAEEGDTLFTQFFLAVARNYIGTHFESHGMKDAHVLQIRQFDLPATPELTALREAIWQRLFTLYEDAELQQDVLRVIHHYSSSPLRVTSSDVVKGDVEHVLPFLETVLSPDSYRHCAVMHDYLDVLDKHDVSIPEDLRDKYCNDTYRLADILLPEWGERKGLDLSYEEYEQYKRDLLEKHTASYKLDDYSRFFEHCLEIHSALGTSRNEYQLQWGVVNALLSLADSDSDLFGRVLVHYLGLQDPLHLNGYSLVQKLVELRGYDGALQLLQEPDYPTKGRWLFYVHEVLPADAVHEGILTHLYELYRVAERVDLPHGMDHLLKYHSLDSRVIAKVVEIVIEKTSEDKNVAYALTMLFNPHTEVAKQLTDLFEHDIELLKKAYLLAEGTQHHSDYNGQAFGRLLDLDASFISEYIAWKYGNTEHGWLSRFDEHRDYAFVWDRHDHVDIMDRVVESVYDHERDRIVSIAPYLITFFQTRANGGEASGETRKRQDSYILYLIEGQSDDKDFMEFLFGVISHFSPGRRRLLVERFVQRNGSFDAFKRLSLEPSSWSGSGSWVPVLQGRVDFWESLLPIMHTVDLLSHKQYVERQIQELRVRIEYEKKKDFIGD